MAIDLSQLNKAQREVVLNTDGPMMILAGAGSGKTRTLVSKISYLLDEKGISPFKVLALTFSNKAAKEMRDRISREVAEDLGALQVTTFHAFCSRVLRTEATYLGLSRNFTIYDTSESKAVVKLIMGRQGISTRDLNPMDILYYIDGLKNAGYYPNREKEDDIDYDLEDEYYSFYLEYEDELRKANAVDFGGLITGVLQLFKTHPQVLESYINRYDYLLVDEYQDTNRAQFDLVRLLSERKRNICVVGDEDQSIYSWRGADIRNILDFEKVFEDARILKLEQNYRSSKTIIEAASYVIARNQQRKGKTMWTDNPEGESIHIVELSNEKGEAEFVANKISKLAKKGVDYRDIAVFYRTNSQSRVIEDYLRRKNLPYRIVGGIKFYERKEVKDLLAYVRLVVNSKDSLALSRIINVPARGVGTTSLRKFEQEAVKANSSLWEILQDFTYNKERYGHIRTSGKVKAAIRDFVNLLEEAQSLEESKRGPLHIFDKLLYESGYWDSLKAKRDYESMARMENLEELRNAIKQFEESEKNPTLVGFLETITLDQTNDDSSVDKSRGEVSLMTVHGAKGLEFPYVLITGAEENIFPSFRSLDEGEVGLEEERRLFYVAMTRAMKELYITFAQGRMLFGQLKFNGASRFINEIPNKFYDWTKKSSSSGVRQEFDDFEFDQSSDDDLFENVVHVDHTGTTETYAVGSRVIHGVYGEGIVKEAEGYGKDEKVLIQFYDGTKKRFLVEYAPLSLV